MMSNSIGRIYKLTSFGESHGKAVGGIIDGCPAGFVIDEKEIQLALDKRRPGQSRITTSRNEGDIVEFLSGIFEGKTTGTPIAFQIVNTNAKSKDYSHMKDLFRPSHADYTYSEKYGNRDYRGGGRTSARETIARVVAGAIAQQILATKGIKIEAGVYSVGPISLIQEINELDFSRVEDNIVRCPDQELAKSMEELIMKTKKAGDTIGGTVACKMTNIPIGLGEPVFDKLHARLAYAMMGINAVKGFEYGSGFEGSKMKGSDHNDIFIAEDGKINTKSNYSGGIQGGISNGQDIYCKVAFKPVATIMIDQETVNTEGQKVVFKGKGRHDPCVVSRAVPIVEAMAAMTLLDFYLISKSINS